MWRNFLSSGPTMRSQMAIHVPSAENSAISVRFVILVRRCSAHRSVRQSIISVCAVMPEAVIRCVLVLTATLIALFALTLAFAAEVPADKARDRAAQSQPTAAQLSTSAASVAPPDAQLSARLNFIDSAIENLSEKVNRTDYSPAILPLAGSLIGVFIGAAVTIWT